MLPPAAVVKGSVIEGKPERALPLPEGLLLTAKTQAAAHNCSLCSLPLELLGPAHQTVCSGETFGERLIRRLPDCMRRGVLLVQHRPDSQTGASAYVLDHVALDC